MPLRRARGSHLALPAAEALPQLRIFMDAAPDAMVVVDADGTVLLANEQSEALFGYTREQLIGRPIEVLVPERFRDLHPSHRSRYFAEPRTRAMGASRELFALRRDGTEFPAEISLSPIHTESGVFVMAAVRDISERRRLEHERRKGLEEANRLKSEFVANMSHELRTPLNSIIGFTKLMFHGKAGDISAQQRDYLQDILRGSEHLLDVINDILDLSKIEAGHMEFAREQFDAAVAIEEVSAGLREMAEAKSISLRAADSWNRPVHGDPLRFRQILYNFLSNAIKFTPDGGDVEVRLMPGDSGSFRLEVQDTGIGIEERDLPKLFLPFSQIDASMGKRYQGTGLGLAVTRRLVEQQGGSVFVRSVPGGGTTFGAVLPEASHGH